MCVFLCVCLCVLQDVHERAKRIADFVQVGEVSFLELVNHIMSRPPPSLPAPPPSPQFLYSAVYPEWPGPPSHHTAQEELCKVG